MYRLWHFLAGGIRFKGRAKQSRRLIALVAGVVLLMLLPVVIWQLTAPSSRAEATWFDGSYGYRQLVSFGNTGSADSNKKVKFDIDTATLITANKLQSDCDDLRFTDYNGKALRFYLDAAGGACNTNSTDFYVLVETIYAGTTNLFMYYGNPLAGVGGENQQFSESTFTPTSGPTYGGEAVTPGPAAYWTLDDAQGQTAQDTTVNNNDGTLGSSSSSDGNDPTWVTEDQCVSGKCLNFGGIDDYVDLGSQVKPSGAMTINLWMKGKSSNLSTSGIGTMGASGTRGYLFGVDSTGQVMGYIASSSTALVTVTASGHDSTRWTHYSFVYSPSTYLRIYRNGKLVAENTSFIPASQYQANGISLKLGQRGDGTYFQGKIDEPKIYSYALSAAQIQAEYNAGLAKLGVADQAYLSNGLVGYWKMDETSWTNNCSTSSVLDSSGNGNNGTACPNSTGPTGGVGGKFGNSGSFDGSNDYLNMGAPASLNLPSQSLSLSAWIYPTQVSTAGILFGKANGTVNGYGLIQDGSSFSFELRESGGTVFTCSSSSGVFSANTWYHVAGVLVDTGSGTEAYLYVNGNQIKTCSSIYRSAATGNFTMGARNTTSTFYNGKMDEVRVYNRALSQAEVQDLYTFAPGPVGHWKLDDASGSSAIDSSGNGYTGTLVNSPAWETGKVGGALNFYRANSTRVTVGDLDALDFGSTGSFTLSTWYQLNQKGGSQDDAYLVSKQGGVPSQVGYGIFYEYADSSIRFSVADGTNNKFLSFGSNSAVANTWIHATLVWDRQNDKVAIYRNGVLVSSQTTLSTVATISNGNIFTIGSRPGGADHFDGYLDDVRIYNYARTPEQIIQDMQADAPPDVSGQKLPDPVAYYALDEQQGQTANNSGIGGSTLNGTLGATTGSSTDDPTWKTNTDCKSNGCASFDGGDFIDLGDLASTESVSQLTVSTWVYDTSYTSSTCFVCKFNHANTQTSWNLQAFNTNAVLAGMPTTTSDGTTYAYTANNTLTTSAWNHVVMVFDGTQTGNSNRLKVYVNGKPRTLTFAGTIPATTVATTSNARLGASSDGARYLSGLLDEVRIYTAALTPEQVNLDYNAGLSQNFGVAAATEESTVASGAGLSPVLYWNFDEKTGSTAKDTSGTSNDGTITGAAWTPGKVGAALNFDGVDDGVTKSSPNSMSFTTAFTLEAWVKTTDTNNGEIIGRTDGSQWSYALHINESATPGCSGGKICLAIDRDGGSGSYDAVRNSVAALNDNRWHHVVGVYDGAAGIVDLYVDGIKSTATLYGSVPASITGSSRPFYAGIDNGSRSLAGAIDDVKVYSYARSASQIAYDYNRGKPLVQLDFDECQGSTINDVTGNGVTGTITIGATGTQTSVGSCQTSSTAWGNGVVGKYSSSLNFDGTDDYVSLGNPTALQSFNQLTVSAWVNGSNLPSSDIDMIFSKDTSGFYLGVYRQKLRFRSSDLTSDITDGTTILANNTWYLLTATWDGSTVRLYINGALEASEAATGTIAENTQSAVIGTFGANSLFFTGKIDDVRLYNYALSADQVKKLSNEGFGTRFGPNTGSP